MLKICIFFGVFFGMLAVGIIVWWKLCFVVLEICFWLLGIGWIFFVSLILLNIIRFCGSGLLCRLEIIVSSNVKLVLVLVIFMLLIMFINIFWLVICRLLWWCNIVSRIVRWFCFSFIVMRCGFVIIEWLISVWIFISSGCVFFYIIIIELLEVILLLWFKKIVEGLLILCSFCLVIVKMFSLFIALKWFLWLCKVWKWELVLLFKSIE